MFETLLQRANMTRPSRAPRPGAAAGAALTALALSGSALSASLLAPSGASAQSARLESTYTVQLDEVDGSGASGTATLIADATGVRVRVTVEGTSAGREHPVALHRANDEASRCPRPSDDRDDDGFVTGDELRRVTGPVGVTVGQPGATGPDDLFVLTGAERAADDGRLTLERALGADEIDADEIGSLHLVVYGNDLNFSNRYEGASAFRPAEATIAVACGAVVLERIDIPEPFAGTNGTSGIVTRLYVAILQRSPEPSGHAYFSGEIDDGASSVDVVWAMASSPEFVTRFGPKLGAGTSEWVDFVYRSIFGRQADTPGRQYWISELDRGALEREAMLFYFADSAEFKTTTATS